MATFQFQTEVNQLLKLIIHSMYSNKDIFLREIVSNASDALDKLNYLKVSDDNYKNINSVPRIDISFDDSNKILTVQDSGIGMTDEDLTNNLGTIARSGTKAFIEKLANEKSTGESNLIGQFGVGFYSAFMAAKQINVYTRKAGTSKIFKWSSDGTNSYSIEEIKSDSEEAKKYNFDKPEIFGSAIEMILNDENELVSTTATRQSDEFDPRRLVKHLSHITPSFMQQFCSQYAIEEVRGNEIYMRVSEMSNPKLYKCIEKTLIQLRENPKLLSYLC